LLAAQSEYAVTGGRANSSGTTIWLAIVEVYAIGYSEKPAVNAGLFMGCFPNQPIN